MAVGADETFHRLSRDFDRLMARSNRMGWGRAPLGVWEDDQAIHLELDVPGVQESDVDVEVHDGKLNLRVDRKPVEGRQYTYESRRYGRFERTVTLPTNVDPNSVQARLSRGVLEVTVAKKSENQPRKVAVQAD